MVHKTSPFPDCKINCIPPIPELHADPSQSSLPPGASVSGQLLLPSFCKTQVTILDHSAAAVYKFLLPVPRRPLTHSNVKSEVEVKLYLSDKLDRRESRRYICVCRPILLDVMITINGLEVLTCQFATDIGQKRITIYCIAVIVPQGHI